MAKDGVLQRAVFDTSGATSHDLVAAVTGKQLFIYAVVISLSGADDYTLKNGSTKVTGAIHQAADATDYWMPLNKDGDNWVPWFEIDAGNAFKLATSGSNSVGGYVLYTEGSTAI